MSINSKFVKGYGETRDDLNYPVVLIWLCVCKRLFVKCGRKYQQFLASSGGLLHVHASWPCYLDTNIWHHWFYVYLYCGSLYLGREKQMTGHSLGLPGGQLTRAQCPIIFLITIFAATSQLFHVIPSFKALNWWRTSAWEKDLTRSSRTANLMLTLITFQFDHCVICVYTQLGRRGTGKLTVRLTDGFSDLRQTSQACVRVGWCSHRFSDVSRIG